MSLFAAADVHCTESTSVLSSNRTPAVVVIFCGGMLYSPKPVCRFLPCRYEPATPTNQRLASYIVSASKPCILACAMFWYCRKGRTVMLGAGGGPVGTVSGGPKATWSM